MNIHEYQAKQVLKKYGVPVLPGGVAYTADEAAKVAEGLPAGVYVVKSQIHAGGRGKGTFKESEAGGKGGVRVVKSVAEVKENAKQMIGNTLVTHQSGPEGKKVKRVYIETGCNIARELYLAFLVDRSTSRVTIMASTEGGVNIEDVAHDTPEKIVFQSIDPATGIHGFHCRKIAFALGLKDNQVKSCTKLLTSLYRAFLDTDASMLEINPLVVTGDGDVLPLDAKMNFDSNALYRHPEIVELRDEDEEDPMELEASKHDLNYIKLDGSIGCMVNGAGLAMASPAPLTMQPIEPSSAI